MSDKIYDKNTATPEAWNELGQLLITMEETDAASQAFQKGLTLSYGGADVPRIGSDMGDEGAA